MYPASLQDVVDLAHGAQGGRVCAFNLPEGKVWLKRVERLTARMRLQKGDPRRGFEAERRALHILGDAGLPVVPVLAEGQDWMVLPDAGPTLARCLADPAMAPQARMTAFARAGQALASLHNAGFAHGRPVLRDICWDGSAARFIDLERFRPRRAGRLARAIDIVVLVQGWFIVTPQHRPELDAMLNAYRAAAGEGAITLARRIAQALRPLLPLVRLVQRLTPRSRDWRAVPLTIGYLRHCAG